MVDVTPFRGSNLTQLFLAKDQMRRQDEQFQFQKDQALRSNQIQDRQLEMAAQKAGLDARQLKAQAAAEAIKIARDSGIQDAEQGRQMALSTLGLYIGDQAARETLDGVPDVMFTGGPEDIAKFVETAGGGMVGLTKRGDVTGNLLPEGVQTLNASNAGLEREAAALNVDKARLERDTKKLELDAAKAMEDTKVQGKVDVASLARNILEKGDFKDVFGKYEGRLPLIFRSQGVTDASADVAKLVNLITLANTEKMTGVLSESDIKILSSAGTILSDRTISDAKAESELRNIIDVMTRNQQVLDKFLSDQTPGVGQSIQVGRFSVVEVQ